MAPYIVTNRDLTINHKIPTKRGNKGLQFNVKSVVKFLESKFSDLVQINDNQEVQLLKFIRLKQQKFKFLYRKSRKSVEQFVEDPQGKKFLDCVVKIPANILSHKDQKKKQKGRKRTVFEKKSELRQKLEARQLARSEGNCVKKLLLALGSAAKSKKHGDLAKVIALLIKDEGIATKFLVSLENHNETYTKEEALSLILETDLSREKYNKIRIGAHQKHSKLYVSWYAIQKAKKEALQSLEIQVTETEATTSLSSLIKNTTERVFLSYNMEDLAIDDKNQCTLRYVASYGFDGASCYKNFNQKFDTANISEYEVVDGSIFASTVNTLEIIEESTGKLVFKNKVPQSPRNCRPLSIKFKKETKELIQSENTRIAKEIECLKEVPIEFVKSIRGVDVTFIVLIDLKLTQIDGKVLSILNESNCSSTCPICLATHGQLNDLTLPFNPVNEDNLSHGIQPLHMWIRLLEALLHVSYKMPIKVFRLSNKNKPEGKAQKETTEQQKLKVKRKILEEFHIKVDSVEQGKGSTNNGPTSRKLFSNPKLFAECLEIPVDIVEAFQTLLVAISCQRELNHEKFSDFCAKTAQLWVSTIPWYPMPQAVHRLVIHGPDLLKNCGFLTFGHYGEDSGESSHKEMRRAFNAHSRKDRRIHTMRDTFSFQILRTDPHLNKMHEASRSKFKIVLDLPQNVVLLLEHPQEATDATDPDINCLAVLADLNKI